MFCVVTNFGCDRQRLKFNIVIRMKLHFLPVTLVFCLIILQRYPAYTSSEQKHSLNTDPEKPQMKEIKEDISQLNSENQVGKSTSLHPPIHHSGNSNHGIRRQSAHTRQQKVITDKLQDSMKLHEAAKSDLKEKQQLADSEVILTTHKHQYVLDTEKRLLEENAAATESKDIKSLEQMNSESEKETDVKQTTGTNKQRQQNDKDETESPMPKDHSKQGWQSGRVTNNIPLHAQHRKQDYSHDYRLSSSVSLETQATMPVEHHDELPNNPDTGQINENDKSNLEASSQADKLIDNVDSDNSKEDQNSVVRESVLDTGNKQVLTSGESRQVDDETNTISSSTDSEGPAEVTSVHLANTSVELPRVNTDGVRTSEESSDEENVKHMKENEDGKQTEIFEVPQTTDDNLPSFDEWKQKMLAVQAEQKKTKNQEVQNMQPLSAMPTNNKKGTKKVNYASVTCGAKIQASNPEAQHPGSILTENKDQYMINPCKVRKWFVVELCTPVQIQLLEIGNLELFSSLPESFLVQVSEGFPTKDWKPVGTFHARDDRAIQSFMVENEQMYAHYIRIEMLSHYGTEHYCPLTVLRVFGLTVIEADEDGEDEPQIPEELDEIAIQDSEKDLTLFSSATDTVINLVKTILNKDEDEASSSEQADALTPEALTDAVQMKTDAMNASAKNITQDKNPNEPVEPCMPDVRSKKDVISDTSYDPPTEPHIPDVSIDAVIPEEPFKSATQKNIPEIQDAAAGEDEESVTDIVTLIQRPSVPMSSYLIGCHYCFNENNPVCYLDRQSVCGYYRILTFVPKTCCLRSPHLKKAEVDVTDVQKESLDVFSLISESTSMLSVQQTITHQTVSADTVEILSPTQQTIADERRSEAMTETPPLSTVPTSESESFLHTHADHSSTPVLFTSTVAERIDTTSQVGPNVIEVRPSSATTDILDTDVKMSNDQVIDPSEETPRMKASSMEPHGEASPAAEILDVGAANGLPDIYAEDPTNHNTDLDLESMSAPSGDDIQYQKLTIGKKETTFMKLKNKIRSLELNLNLSSQYLEQLSQRYKKQMEEMYISLNRTINKLADTSRKAEEKDVKQQEHIIILQRQINALNVSLESLRENISLIHVELIERHLFLMVIEAAIFLLVLAWCLHRQEKSIFNLQDHARKITVTGSPKNPYAVKAIKVGHVRRNSADDTPHRLKSSSSVLAQRRAYDDCDIKKSGSESDLTRILPTTLDVGHSGSQQSEATRKKRKRRSNNAQKSLLFGHFVGNSLIPTSSSSCRGESSDLCTDVIGKNTTYMGHAPKKRDLSTTKKRQINGHVTERLLPSKLIPKSHDQSVEDCGLIRRHSSEHLVKQKIHHRKSPSLDRNIYSMLSVNGMDECNGYVNT